ncbi:hypothetical protein FA95DRAFT_1516207 [Auriscalpium vulgare]|uniref:Uncharacterized protein n=1 Tax=Auriscalpium vulgare TaxID=40419 RepID=A0ACB8RZ14_9AGAM|nr:hypothetical protein FA95DRAFT_1516207 [Auriscalpium vulgare]
MPDTLETAQHFIFVTQVYFCSMYAVVLWDWVISLPREWQYVWKTHWTPVKVAYLFCRYWVISVVPYLLFSFVTDHTMETCEKIYKIPVALALWNQVGSESVLLIRTYAFFNRSNAILAALLCALGGVIAYQLYVDTSQMLVLPFVTPPFDKGPCFPMSKPHSAHLLGFFIAPLGFDTLVTMMTVWKAFTIRRRNGGPSSRLIQTFLREGVFYYLLISIANLINGIFYLQPRQVISAINIPLSVMLSPVLACRLILDLRERGSETVTHSDGHTYGSHGSRGGAQYGIQFSQHRSVASSGAVQSGFTRSRTTYGKPNPANGVVLSTLGSDAGPITDSDLELKGIHHDGMDDEIIEDLKAGDLGLGGIRVDVEKTSDII